MYKKITDIHKEDTGSGGGWNSFAVIKKDNQFKRGYVQKVRVSFILDDRVATSSTDALANSFPTGVLFCASRAESTGTIEGEANQLNPDYLVGNVYATSATGGTFTLYLNQSIAQNTQDVAEQDGPIWLWMKNSDLTIDDNLRWRIVIESYGRYHTAEGL